ncbi:hypothetical protein LZ31DRAFT_158184 [Colletotrichum somersetense]|nr:hypothetical protein LZ31DRAFT_158184 [Colletotrichum somersetense]
MRAQPDRLDRPTHSGDRASTKPDTPPASRRSRGSLSEAAKSRRLTRSAGRAEKVCGYESSRTGCRAAMRQRRPHCGSNRARDNGIVPGTTFLGQARAKNHQQEHEPSQHKVHEGCWIKLNCR